MVKKIEKLKREARGFLRGRQYAQAARAYAQLMKADPQNARWPHKLGEVNQRLDRGPAAVDAYRRSARIYAEQGFLLKAIALCKMILALDPAHQETQDKLAALYARRSGRAGSAPRKPPPAKPPLTARRKTPARPEVKDPDLAAFIRPEAESPSTAADHARGRALPTGAALDAVELRRVVPGARRRSAASPAGAIFEIPLDPAEIDAAFRTIVKRPPSVSEDVPAQIPPTPLFSSLDPETLKALIERVAMRRYPRGELIIRQGERGHSLFVLVEGEVAVYRGEAPRMELGRLQEGDFFGEIALVTQRERSASVQALTPSTVLELTRDVVKDLLQNHPALLTTLLRFFRERLIDTLIGTSELFAPFAGADRDQLVERFTFIEAEPGSLLLKKGVKADGLYILLSGQAELRRVEGAAEKLATGDVFGETSLLTGKPAAGSVRTETQCWLLKLGRKAFREVIMTHPHVLAVVGEISARRRERALAVEEKLPVL